MMENRRLKKIDSAVISCGAFLCCCATFFWDLQITISVVAGAFLAAVNWIGFRYLIVRMMTSTNRVRFAVLVAVKTLAVFGTVFVVVLFAPINVFAFVIGLSSLVCGIFVHSVRDIFSTREPTLEEEF
ncbi:MAG: hypothetical protein GY854_07885 [Deltaproteobacteria bacterium]|nr:hypothetical protein [Deltaproteobacteria bacterium]